MNRCGHLRDSRSRERRGRILVELGPVVMLWLTRDQGLITMDVGKGRLGHPILGGHDHDALDLGQLLRQALEQGHEVRIDEQEPVLGMVHDVDQLIGEQAGIDGVQDHAGAGGGVINLQMTMRVPADGPDPIAGLRAERDEPMSQLLGAAIDFGVIGPMNVLLDGPSDDLALGMILSRIADQRRDQQRHLHHQPTHQTHGSDSLSRPAPAPPRVTRTGRRGQGVGWGLHPNVRNLPGMSDGSITVVHLEKLEVFDTINHILMLP